MTALPDPAADLTGFVLAVADLREKRTARMGTKRWASFRYVVTTEGGGDVASTWPDTSGETAEHIAAEANPGHALAEVALWRGVVGRHKRLENPSPGRDPFCEWCDAPALWPCPDLLQVIDAAKAYAGAS